MHDQPKYTKLRNVILATIFLFALLPMLVVGVTIPMQFTGLYHEKTVREVENIARTKGKLIDVFFEERIALLRTITQMHSYDDLTKDGKLLSILHVMKANSQSYVDMGVIDMEGNHVTYAGSYNVSTVNYKNEEWFSEVRRKGVYVSDVFLGFRNFPHIIIAVMREEGAKSWILRATVDSTVFTSMVQSSRLSAGGEAFVVNKKSELQTPFGENAVMDSLPLTWPKQNIATTDAEMFLNRSMLLAKVPLQEVPWLLVVAENPEEHFSLLFKAKAFAIGLICLGVLALCVGTWLTTRKIVNKLILVDQEKAELDSVVLQSSKMAALGKMAAGVAHEINNPLMLIREYAGWMKDLLDDQKAGSSIDMNEMERAASKIEQNVDRAKDVTHRLLGFARRVNPSTESLPLSPIIDQTIGFLQNEAAYRNITITREYSPLDLRVHTDVGQLQQVMLNILDNALDAAPVDGHVAISTGLTEDAKVFIKVSDDGPGFPETGLASLFDPFFTTKSPGKGTGLGLSICYSIMKNLDGNIIVGSAEGGGAEITIILASGTDET